MSTSTTKNREFTVSAVFFASGEQSVVFTDWVTASPGSIVARFKSYDDQGIRIVMGTLYSGKEEYTFTSLPELADFLGDVGTEDDGSMAA